MFYLLGNKAKSKGDFVMRQNSINLISSDKNLDNLLHAKKMYAVLKKQFNSSCKRM